MYQITLVLFSLPYTVHCVISEFNSACSSVTSPKKGKLQNCNDFVSSIFQFWMVNLRIKQEEISGSEESAW